MPLRSLPRLAADCGNTAAAATVVLFVLLHTLLLLLLPLLLLLLLPLLTKTPPLLVVVMLLLGKPGIVFETGLPVVRNVEVLLEDKRSVTECEDGHPLGLIAEMVKLFIVLISIGISYRENLSTVVRLRPLRR